MVSPKGWPTTKKSDSIIPGFTPEQTKTLAEFSTVQNTGSDRVALDTTQRVAFVVSTGNAIEAGTTKRVIKCTGINARKGDLIKFTSGALVAIDAPVLSAPDANTLILVTELDAIPVIGVTFELCRYTFFKVDSSGQIVATSGALTFKKDGLSTEVSLNTLNPAASVPLPVAPIEPVLIDGDVGDYVIDDTIGVTLYTGSAKKIRLVQNGGEMLYIFKDNTKLGALEAGGKIEFSLNLGPAESLVLKTKTGTATTNICWNIFN